MPLLSVIIPTCHRNQDLDRCLEALTRDCQATSIGSTMQSLPVMGQPDFDYEIIVSDDGTVSTAQAMLQTTFPFVRWVRGPRRGPAANRNRGAKIAQGDWLLFLDDDCTPAPGWIASYAEFSRSPGHSVLEGKTLPTGKRTRPDQGCPINETGGLLWSCNFAIRRKLFLEIGCFDEEYRTASMEDLDLHIRLRRIGHQIQFVSDALVMHPWKLRGGLKFVRLQARSISYFVNKHPEAKAMFPRTWGLTMGTRALIKEFPLHLFRFGAKGSFRGLGLDLALATSVFWPLITRNGPRNSTSTISATDSNGPPQSAPAARGVSEYNQ